MDQKTMVPLYNGILCSRKKEGALTLHNSKDGTGENYIKWNKPGGERQIPYDLTYKWNMMNKTKQAKYNQIHWNKEQTDSYQRGGEAITRESGEESPRNIYKGHMDKAKGG